MRGQFRDLGNITGNVTLDASTGPVFSATLIGNVTFSVQNLLDGEDITVIITQDGVGSRTVAWNGAGGMTIDSAPSVDDTAGSVTSLVIRGTNAQGGSRGRCISSTSGAAPVGPPFFEVTSTQVNVQDSRVAPAGFVNVIARDQAAIGKLDGATFAGTFYEIPGSIADVVAPGRSMALQAGVGNTFRSDTPGATFSTDYPSVTELRVSIAGQLHVRHTAANQLIQIGNGGNVQVDQSGGQRLGFYGQGPVLRPTVTGSRGGNAALASLLTQLQSLGLIIDGSVA